MQETLLQIPIELLSSIASYLHGKDFCNFRLVNQKCAAVCLHQIPKNGISLLNTAEDLESMEKLLASEKIARNVKHLKFLFSEWPIAFSRNEWEKHPLLLAGNDRGQSDSSATQADEAFEEYCLFEAKERNRIYSQDVEKLMSIFSSLPNLNSIVVCHMQHCVWKPASNSRYNKLIKRIWMSPYLGDDISPGLVMLLLALENHFHKITKLDIRGSFNPEHLVSTFHKSNHVTYGALKHIRELHVDFRVIDNEGSIVKFLESFPNILSLSIRFQGMGPAMNIIGVLEWQHIKTLQLSGLWTSEQEIYQAFEYHHKTLERFVLKSSALTEGSWRSLFTRIRDLQSRARVVGKGELYGRTHRETLNMHLPKVSTSLIKFIEDETSDWPF